MFQWVLYFAAALLGAGLVVLALNHKKTYHSFMVQQLNQRDQAYDDIYTSIGSK